MRDWFGSSQNEAKGRALLEAEVLSPAEAINDPDPEAIVRLPGPIWLAMEKIARVVVKRKQANCPSFLVAHVEARPALPREGIRRVHMGRETTEGRNGISIISLPE